MKEDECIDGLRQLGLTFLQAKVYAHLLRFEKAEAKTISIESNIARADIYRVMSNLESLGLVEKIISTPLMYQAAPIEEGCRLLLQSKQQEYLSLKKTAADLVRNTPEYFERMSNE